MADDYPYDVPLSQLNNEYIKKRSAEDSLEIRNLLWSTRLEEAKALAAKTKNRDMFGHVRYAETLMWQYVIMETEEYREAAEKELGAACEGCEAAKAESDPITMFSFFYIDTLGKMRELINAHALALSAFAKLGQSFMELKGKKYLPGAYHLRASHQLFLAAEAKKAELDKSVVKPLEDTLNFGLGFFRFVSSLVPENFQWAAKIVGFTPDREGGLNQLKQVYTSGGPSYTEAGIILGIKLFFFDENIEEAMKIVSALVEQKPKSVFLLTFKASILKFQGAIPEAIETQLVAANLASEYKMDQLKINVSYNLADMYFFSGDYENAIPLQKDYFYKSRRPNFKAFCGWKLGFALYQTQREKATKEIIDIYNKVIKDHVEEHESFDRYSRRKCETFLKLKRIEEVEMLLIPLIWLAEVKQYDELLQKLAEIRNKLKEGKSTLSHTKDHVALIEYLTGVGMVGKKEFKEGEKHLQRAVKIECVEETWITPYAYYWLAKSALLQKNVPQGKKMCELAGKGPAKFDFDGKQRIFVKNTLQKLDALEKEMIHAQVQHHLKH